MALLNTAANSMPISARTMASMTNAISCDPGTANHSIQQPMMPTIENSRIHGLRGPDASAIAPSTGDDSAMIRPPMPVA